MVGYEVKFKLAGDDTTTDELTVPAKREQELASML